MLRKIIDYIVAGLFVIGAALAGLVVMLFCLLATTLTYVLPVIIIVLFLKYSGVL